jgi:hypothetical protein
LADVGKGLEVRWTSYIGGNLIVYPNDRDHDIAVLVVGKSPEYFIAGWLPVMSAKVKAIQESASRILVDWSKRLDSYREFNPQRTRQECDLRGGFEKNALH